MDSKFNFVYEDTTEEDKKFINKFQIYRQYHGGTIRVPDKMAVDREKGMFLVDNDYPGALVLDGIDGPEVCSFIYKNVASKIYYRHSYNNFKYSLMIEDYYVDTELRDEKQYVMDAMREALIERVKGIFGNCELVSDNRIIQLITR